MTSLFLSLDGLDGTGKSTQARLLAEWLRGQGHTVVECADPGGTPVGQVIRDLLLDPRHALTPACEALLFMASRAIPKTLRGLLGLSIIHFARWIIIKRNQWPDLGQGKQSLRNDYVLFCSNFNGTWDQYIDAFSDGIPSGLDLLWYSSTRYPHSIPISPFKNYIRANQVDTDYYYNSVPGAAQRDIKSALRIRRALVELAAKQAALSPEDFRKQYVAALVGVQNELGYQGYAPIASVDTDNADRNREDYVRSQQQAAKALL